MFGLCALLLCALCGYAAAQTCGRPPIPPEFSSAYVVNGDEAKPHSLPWMVSIQESRFGRSPEHHCGGSIINDRWILTAAHCMKESPFVTYTVMVGMHSLSSRSTRQRSYFIRRIINHEQFNPDNNRFYDIALLELEQPIELNDHVQPICLPDKTKEWHDGQNFVVSGWGSLDEKGNKPDSLQQVIVPYFNRDDCKAIRIYRGVIHEKVLCVGFPEGGKDACQGDSGGPLVAFVDGQWMQAGVVSWGGGCARPDRPGVYTHVAKYRDWIENIVKN